MVTKVDARSIKTGARLENGTEDLVASNQLTWDYVSPLTSFVNDTKYAFNHGLGSDWTDVLVGLECISPVNGYSIGDFIPFWNHGINYNHGMSTTMSIVGSTGEVIVQTSAAGPYIFNRSATNSHVLATNTNWRIKVRVRK